LAEQDRPESTTALREALPDIMTAGIPTPPDRPMLVPTAAAYASLTPEITLPSAAEAVPLPIRRPLSIDQASLRQGGDKLPEPAIPETKVAMLGGMPGAGLAINALARMEPMAPIAKGSCPVEKPYRVAALGPSGRTELQPAATLDYPMVEGLVRWEAALQASAQRTLGEPIIRLHVAASYDCRTMNHRRRAHLSEHARANAVDISEYETASGKRISVRSDFHSAGPKGDFLRQIHANTCDIFQVVLGPGSDGLHEDHFHMDLGPWKACR
jgi:hypothetical protein